MIAQNRPDIANVTEQTVLALKELEGRIGILKGDLVALCQGLGHPEAARIAASPSPSPGAFGTLGAASFANPYGTAFASPFATAPSQPFGLFGNPNAAAYAPWASGIPASYGIPTASSVPSAFQSAGYGAVNPYVAAVAQAAAFSAATQAAQAAQAAVASAPWLQAAAAFATPYTASGSPTTSSPFAAVPAGYR